MPVTYSPDSTTVARSIGGQANINTPSAAWERQIEDWCLIDDLMGGTKKMRQRASKWLPPEPEEKPEAYKVRLDRSFLHPGYSAGVEGIVARPFSKGVSVDYGKDETPDERLVEIEDDVDGEMTNLTQFTRRWFEWSVHRGMSHALIDSNIGKETSSTPRGELQQRVRWIHIDAKDLIFARFDGDDLVEIRYRYCVVEPDPQNEFGEKVYHQVRRILLGDRVGDVRTGTWEVWRQEGNADLKYGTQNTQLEKWEIYDRGDYTPPVPYIPLVTMPVNMRDRMESEPALLDLAWLNVMHWQSSSDQRNILRFLRIGILLVTGVNPVDAENMPLGPFNVWKTSNPDASLSTPDFSGKPAEVGRQDLIDIEEKMERLSAEPFVTRRGDVTATAAAIDTQTVLTDVQCWIQAAQRSVKHAYELTAAWMGFELPEEFKVDIHQQFSLPFRALEQMKENREAAKANLISKRLYLTEGVRLGQLPETLDVDEELEESKTEREESNDFEINMAERMATIEKDGNGEEAA